MEEFLCGPKGIAALGNGMELHSLSEQETSTCPHGFQIMPGMAVEVTLYTQYHRVNAYGKHVLPVTSSSHDRKIIQ